MASRPAPPAEAADRPEPEPAGAPLDLGHLVDIVGYPLRRAQMALFEDFARRFAPLKLTPAQYSTLAVIAENPGRKQSEIGAALGIQRPNFVAMLDELESRGLAGRLRSETDRRSNAVALTPAGQALYARARKMQEGQEEAVDRLIGRETREALVAILNQLARLA